MRGLRGRGSEWLFIRVEVGVMMIWLCDVADEVAWMLMLAVGVMGGLLVALLRVLTGVHFEYMPA